MAARICRTDYAEPGLAIAGGTVRDAWRYEPGEVPDLDEVLEAARALPS